MNNIVQEFLKRAETCLPGFLGFTVEEVQPRYLLAKMEIKPILLAPNRFLHGGTVVAFADSAAGFGCLSCLPEGAESFTTIELKCNFVGTARTGHLLAEAKAAHLGKTTQVWDVVVSREMDKKVIALFRATQHIFYPPNNLESKLG